MLRPKSSIWQLPQASLSRGGGRASAFLSLALLELENLGFHIATQDGFFLIRMGFMVRCAAAQSKTPAFGMVGNTHFLFGRILREGRFTHNPNFVACEVAIQVGIWVRIDDGFATAFSRRRFLVLLKCRKEVCDRAEIRNGIVTRGFRRQ